MSSPETIVGVISIVVVVIGAIYFMRSGKSDSPEKKEDKDDNQPRQRSRTFSNVEEKFPAGKMVVYFGSQTGTAEGFARVLVNEGHTKGFDAKLVDLEDYTPEDLQESRLAVFLVATYGEGDPTDNASSFCTWATNSNKDVPGDFLSNVDFAVFGLGNTQYENYNLMGKNVNKWLEELGGKRTVPYGEGDDDSSLEEDFEAWKEDFLWPSLLSKYHPSGKSAASTNGEMAHIFELTFRCEPCAPAEPVIPSPAACNNSTRYFFTSPAVPVTVSRELRTPKDPGSTFHMEVDISNAEGITYHTADNLAVLPLNREAEVAALAERHGYDLDQTVRVIPLDTNADVANASHDVKFKHPFPTPNTIRTILSNYVDIQGIPRRSTLEQLSSYCKDPAQLAWLKDIVSKQSHDRFRREIVERGRSFASIMENELSSCKVPLADLLHILPFIQPRYYTISSSSNCYPESIHITVSLYTQERDGHTVNGLCTHYLKDLTPGRDRVRVFVRDSLFRLPPDPRTPIIMVGPGTGIAPMRGLLQDRQRQATTLGANESMTNILYFGCKNADEDYIYRDELEAYVNDGTLTALHCAFSRAQKYKVYVQNLLERPEDGAALSALILDKGAYVYICGGTAMGASVHEAFVSNLVKYQGMSVQDSTDYVKKMQKEKKFVQELWST